MPFLSLLLAGRQLDCRLSLQVNTTSSDTVNASLNYICYHLASDDRVAQELRKELDSTPDMEDFSTLRSLPYLNAVIEESLRLHPLVPTGLARQTPPEGITIGDTFIPGDVTVVAPAWSVSRRTYCP